MDKDQITTSVNANNSTTTTTTTITTTIITTQNNEYITINYILNTFSILSSLLLLILIITIRIKEVKFSNRISLRLIMYISITEIFFSISQMIRVDNRHFSIWSSYLSSWGYVFTTLLICSLIMSILINIQLTFIYSYKDLAQLKNLKRYYLMAAISFSILLSAIPITFGKFNFDQKRNYFWYDTIIWEWISYSGWVTFTILYCLVSVITMSYHLNKRPRNVSQIMPYDLNTSFNSNATTLTSTTLTPLSKRPTQSKIVSKYISRIILYSLIPILGYLPTIITNLIYYYMDYTERNSFSLNLLSLIFISSQSIFTFIIFLFDPIIDEVILERINNIEIKQTVLDNIQKGVYVANIYDVDRELPSNRESPNSNNNRESPNHSNDNRKSRRNTIYNYALNAKNRISGLTFVLYNRKKSVEIKKEIKDVFELENEENDLLVLL